VVTVAHHKQTPYLRTSGISFDLASSFFLPTKVLCKYDNPINWAIIILLQGIPPLVGITSRSIHARISVGLFMPYKGVV
jgi:hypothetical protein